jgi:predicted DsbA family dithiol-disulfide isomerase
MTANPGYTQAMAPHGQRIELVLFHDVLCSWCLIADARLRWLQRYELHDQVVIRYMAFPTRHRDTVPTPREIKTLARHYTRVAKTNEGWGIVPDVWSGGDPPLSTIPPLVALEAARRQGVEARDRLWQKLRRAAFWDGINVARRDVLIELAERAELDVDRFLDALEDPATEHRVMAEHDDAETRKINGVPALVLRPLERYPGSPEWIAAGCRDIWEYREMVMRFRDKLEGQDPERLRH